MCSAARPPPIPRRKGPSRATVALVSIAIIGVIAAILLQRYEKKAARQQLSNEMNNAPQVSDDDLVAEFEDNAIAAEKKWHRVFYLTGTVESVNKDVVGTPYLILRATNGRRVQCIFDSSSAGLESLRKGQKVGLLGSKAISSAGGVRIRECLAVSPLP